MTESQDLQRLSSLIPALAGHGLDLDLGGLDGPARELLLAAALPHEVDLEVAGVLLPDLDGEVVAAAYRQVAALPGLTATDEHRLRMEPGLRAAMRDWWDADAERRERAVGRHRALVSCFERRRGEDPSAAVEAEREEIYHLTAADPSAGLARFETAWDRLRERFAFADAGRLLDAVQEQAPGLAAADRAWLDCRRGEAWVDAHEVDRARAAFDAVIDGADTPPDVRAHAWRGLARLEIERRRWSEAEQFLARAAEACRALPEAVPLRARILADRATVQRETGALADAQETIAEALLLSGDDPSRAALQTERGLCLERQGETGRALTAFQTAAEQARAAGRPGDEARALNNLGAAHARWARWDDAREHLERARELARRAGDLSGQASALANLSRIAFAEGDEERAVAAAADAVERATAAGDWRRAGLVRQGTGRALRRLDRLPAAREAFAEAAELLRRAEAHTEAVDADQELVEVESLAEGPRTGWSRLAVAALGLGAIGLAGVGLAIVAFGVALVTPDPGDEPAATTAPAPPAAPAASPASGREAYFGIHRLDGSSGPAEVAMDVVVGGEVDAGRFAFEGTTCGGRVSPLPTIILELADVSRLEIDIRSGGGDTTLVVRAAASSSWACDGAEPDGRDARLSIDDPGDGVYEVWVGSIDETRFPARLTATSAGRTSPDGL